MIVPCMHCSEENDLTELGVGVGHVLDCAGCGNQLRVALFGEAPVGIREDELRGKEAADGNPSVLRLDQGQ
jgi:hypothetical protein